MPAFRKLDLLEAPRRYLSWWVRKRRLERRIPHVKVGYMAAFLDCSFEHGHSLGEHSVCYASSFGRFTYYGSHTSIRHAEIGSFCSIGSFVTIGLWSHPIAGNVSTHPLFFSSIGQAGGVRWTAKDEVEEALPVKIGHDVWIGDHVQIRGGVSIGNGAVVGAGAVVTKDVPAYCIVVGVPARLIRERFSPDIAGKLESLEWWNWEENRLRSARRRFASVETLLEV